MITIEVNTSKKYDVIVGSGILNNLCHYMPTPDTDTQAIVISDSNVWPSYGEKCLMS